MAFNQIHSNLNKKLEQVKLDLDRLTNNDNYPGLQGQITASLNSIKKQIFELKDLAKREISTIKREKNLDKAQQATLEYERIKKLFDNEICKINSHQLFGDRDLNQRKGSTVHKQQEANYTDTNMEQSTIFQMEHFQKELNSLNNSESKIDGFIDISRKALLELHEQRGIIKGAQKRLLNIANRLGLSSSIIKYIEKRSREDFYILIFGIIFSIFIMYLIVHYLT
ncbi:protein transport protein bos1 [Clydaea vesicula]|uniref:Protein transport protein BOS1 n=1 Tax=Clydaea vesicula TaxID=447962 RepID=A0AAD5U0A1_9FUNG|nr:protein transport protein bos1 [Clydaea vesicula]KAJ3385018.1 protein transport protein bos1 [Lobulomyces angularis]